MRLDAAKNRTVARGGRLTDVVTLIPDENGSENALMGHVAWGDAFVLRTTDALGVPRTVIPLAPVVA
jgi:hypothetical protein